MSKEYQDLLETLLAIDTLKDEVMAIDSDPNLIEEEKYMRLTLLALETSIRSKQ